MPSQLSTAASDAILAVSAFHVCHQLCSINTQSAAGVGLMGAAASLGTIRFLLSSPSLELVSWHQYLSWLSAALGIPLIASGFIRSTSNLSWMANLLVACGIAGLLLRSILSDSVAAGFSTLVAGASILSMLAFSVLHFNANIIVFAVLFLLAAGPVGTNGRWFGILRVDIFHYLLVVALLALMKGLSDKARPIYYS